MYGHFFFFFFKYFNTELCIFWKKNVFRVTILNLNFFVKPTCFFFFFSLMVLLGFYIYAKYLD